MKDAGRVNGVNSPVLNPRSLSRAASNAPNRKRLRKAISGIGSKRKVQEFMDLECCGKAARVWVSPKTASHRESYSGSWQFTRVYEYLAPRLTSS